MYNKISQRFFSYLLPVYLLVNPVLLAFVVVNELAFYVDTPWLLVDLRMVFYFLFTLAIIWRISFGLHKKEVIFVFVTFLFAGIYFFSVAVATTLDKYIPFQMVTNGGAYFFIIFLYAYLHRNFISLSLLFTCFSFLMIIASCLGIVLFSRFVAQFSFTEIIGGGLAEQLWRLFGGKTQFIPAVILQTLIFIHFKDSGWRWWLALIALFLGFMLLLVSSQRAAIPLLLIIAYVFTKSFPSVYLRIGIFMLGGAFFLYNYELINEFMNLTFINKINTVEMQDGGGRFAIWSVALKALTENFYSIFIGIGDGTLNSINYHYWLSDAFEPDNGILYLWACFGLFGTFGIIAIIAYKLRSVIHRFSLIESLLIFYFFLNYAIVGFYFYLSTRPSDVNLIVTVIVFIFFLERCDTKPCKS